MRAPEPGTLAVTFKSIAAPKTRSILLQYVHADVLKRRGNVVIFKVPEGTEDTALEFLRGAQAVHFVTRQVTFKHTEEMEN